VVGLLIAGFVGTALAAYVADRVLKARSQARKMRAMRDRLAAATARAEVRHEQRAAAAQAGAALTSVMPAIERPPLTLPGVPPRGVPRPRAGCERAGQQDHRSAHPGGSRGSSSGTSPGALGASGRQASRTGQHAAERAGQNESERSTS